MKLLSILRSLTCAAALFGAGLGHADPNAQSLKQRLRLALQLIETSPSEGYAALVELAALDHPKSIERLGYYTLKGVGAEADLQAAIALYTRATALGHERAWLSLAKAKMLAGHAEEALAAFHTAQSLGIRGAEASLLMAHASHRLGPLSDADAAWPQLVRLAQTGDRTAEIAALYVAGRYQRRIGPEGVILSAQQTRAADGDGKAAETLLRYYRLTPKHRWRQIPQRLKLLKHPNLSERARIEEGLYMALDRTPERFWTASEALVQQASNAVYPRALTTTARINRNAYVRIVQKELARLGYGPGRSNGYLHRRTLDALMRFCRDQDIDPDCRVGPIKSTAIKSIAAALAETRS